MIEQQQGQMVVPPTSPFYQTLAAMRNDVEAFQNQLNGHLADIYRATEQAKQTEQRLAMAQATYNGVLQQEQERQKATEIAEARAKAKAEAEAEAKAKK